MVRSRHNSQTNRSSQKRKQRTTGSRLERRAALIETLEQRQLLAADTVVGPSLIGIRPDANDLLLDGETLNEVPRQYSILFNDDISAASVANSTVKLVRSGGDDIFGNGDDVEVASFVGLDAANEVLLRPFSSASSNVNDPTNQLPDDLYQIQIIGSGANQLTNTAGQAFNDGVDGLTTFRIDRGAQVIAIDPQPVTRDAGGGLVQATNQIEVFFDDQDLDPALAEDPAFYQLVLTDGTLTDDDDFILLPQSVDYDSATNKAVLTFAGIPEGNLRLDIGEAGAVSSAPLNIGTLFSGVDFSYSGFIGDANGVSNDSDDVDLYQTQLSAGATLDVAVTPRLGNLSLRARLIDSSGTVLQDESFGPGAVTSFTQSITATDLYTIEVTSTDGSVGAYRINAVVSGSTIDASDDNSSIATATDLNTLGNNTVRFSSQIEPQNILLPPLPGGEDDPGHRDILRQQHTTSRGTTPVAPQDITVVTYHFPDEIGDFPNLITEAEKQIVREVYEAYAASAGLQLVESEGTAGTAIVKADLRAFNPFLSPTDPNIQGRASSDLVLANATRFTTANSFFGDEFTDVMFHHIGISLGLGLAFDLPSTLGGINGTGVNSLGINDANQGFDVQPGNHDVVHLQRIAAPNSTDVDLYKFDLAESGRFEAETFAERLATPSHLNTVLSLFQQTASGEIELVARNDQYIGDDSLLDLHLDAGTYFVGVTSTGNTAFNPLLADSGSGGRTDGAYDLQLRFTSDSGQVLKDSQGTDFDGDADGVPGGQHSFWFQAAAPNNTLFVDKLADTTPGDQGTGALSDPFDTIDAALQAAGNRIIAPAAGAIAIADGEQFVIGDGVNSVTFEFGTSAANPVDLSLLTSADDVAVAIRAAIRDAVANGQLSPAVIATVNGSVVDIANAPQIDIAGSPSLLTTPNVVRVVGNAGADGDFTTLDDNVPYEVGLDQSGFALEDGGEFFVPQGVNVVIGTGTLIKLRRANLDAGATTSTINRLGGSIQVIGTPEAGVFLRSWHDDTAGGDSDGNGPAPSSGDFGGIVFREDSDFDKEGIFLNYVNHADIQHGGGQVFVDGSESVFSSVHLIDSRPTVSFNTIQDGSDAAISANPNSFDDSLGRIGPTIRGNFLNGNTIDGLFVRVETALGSTIDTLDVSGRFDDNDIVHVLTENLIISGAAGGLIESETGVLTARPAGRLQIDGGTVLKLSDARIEVERGGATLIAEGSENAPIILTSFSDDRYGGSGSFDNNGGGANPLPGDWGGIYFGQSAVGSIDNAVVTFAGGVTPVEGGAASFNAVEIHQADVRIANSLFETNASQAAGSERNGRGGNTASTIHVRGAQPIIVDNQFINNAGDAININASALNFRTNPDTGRSTGPIDSYSRFATNQGPLVRLNEFQDNDINALVVRGELLTTQGVWDDTDVVHVLRGEVSVDNLHTFGGLTLQSSNEGSLVIKVDGANSGFTATGTPLDFVDRVGGTLQVLGAPLHPVVITSIDDDSVGAGFRPDGELSLDTNNNGETATPAAWRGLLFDEFSNDRNVEVQQELESPLTGGNSINETPTQSQHLGVLAPNELSGDENRRLGFEVTGFISPDDTSDVDVYSFDATPGTEVWIDIDRTDFALDTVIEVVNIAGTVLARSIQSNDPTLAGTLNAEDLTQVELLGGDHYSQNPRDAGLRYVLQGSSTQESTYFVRVRSAGTSPTSLDGQTSGRYTMQIRLNQVQEFPGSTVRFADIRFANTGIDVRGLPAHSPFAAEAGEQAGNNNLQANAQTLVNLFATDIGAIGISGSLDSGADVDWYEIPAAQLGVQHLAENTADGLLSVTFDLDFADGLVRPDTNIAVFEDTSLIYFGRASAAVDDQVVSAAAPVDLSRGSFDSGDAFIGPITLRAPSQGVQNYFVAVMSGRVPAVLDGVINGNATNPGLRIEPINSVQRVVEDHIGEQGYESGGSLVSPIQAAGIFDINNTPVGSSIGVDSHIDVFDLGDVVAFGATNNGTVVTNKWNGIGVGDNDQTRVGQLPNLIDLAVRSDAEVFGLANGQIHTLNPDTIVSESARTFDGVVPYIIGSGTTTPTALTYDRNGAGIYDEIVVAHERFPDNGDVVENYLFRRSDGDTDYTLVGKIQSSTVTHADLEIGINDGTTPSRIRLESRVPGVEGNSFTLEILAPTPNANVAVNRVGNAFSVAIGTTATAQDIIDEFNTDFGMLLEATLDSGSPFTEATNTDPEGVYVFTGGGGTPYDEITGIAYSQYAGTDLIAVTDDGEVIELRDSDAVVTDDVVFNDSFQAITLGPQNVEQGAFANRHFVLASDGDVFEFDGLTPVASRRIIGASTGLAFSPLDFNLWHTTTNRGGNPGHGIPQAPDGSRGAVAGNTSFYFGYETAGTQRGILNPQVAADLATNNDLGTNYNFPGGASGDLVSDSFSLADFDEDDEPVLYFNYFLDGDNAAAGDYANVFISTELFPDIDNAGHWENVAINRGGNNPRLHESDGAWRQARFDLAEFAGEDTLTLRFEFDTAGPQQNSGSQSIRSTNNANEGFYIDDIIIGFANRGESISNAPANTATIVDSVSPSISVGNYQLEIRQNENHLALDALGNARVAAVFTPDDRHITSAIGADASDTILESVIDFEPGSAIPALNALVPWSVTSTNPFTGTLSLESASNAFPIPSTFQASLADLGIATAPAAGVIEFDYATSDGEGFAFLIDGLSQQINVPNNDSQYTTARFSFGSTDPEFVWVHGGSGRSFVDNIRVYQGNTALQADQNRVRPQGAFIVHSNTITDSVNFGINVEPGSQGSGGAFINFPTLPADDEQLVPGIVIENNVIAGSSGIRFAGETTADGNAALPFGRIINNTITNDGTGTGIVVDGRASPTIFNNLLANLNTGIVDNGIGTVVRSNFFQDNMNNGVVGTAFIIGDGSPLFTDAANGNYYLDANSLAVDSSQNTEQDRFNYLIFKTELGVPASPIIAPERDVFGQLRVDSGGTAGGSGSTIFRDRGAIDRADFETPYAVLVSPTDNAIDGSDIDPNDTFLQLTDQIQEQFTIFLGDGPGPNFPVQGTGVNGLTVDDPTDITVSTNSVEVRENDWLLEEGVDYTVGYDPLTGILLLTPLAGLWDPTSVYTITLNNTAIADRAGNRLRSNRDDGSTAFTIIMPLVEIDFGDNTDSFGTVLANDGARHALVDGAVPRLGTYIDGETDSAGFGTDDFDRVVGVDGNILSLGDGPFTVSLAPENRVVVQLDSLPSPGDNIEITTGNRTVVFELTENGGPVSLGRVPVSYPTGATIAQIVEQLANQMNAAFLSFDIQATAIHNAGETELVLRGEDDEDGIGIGPVNVAGNIVENLLVEPSTGEFLDFLNPQALDGSDIVVTTQGGGYLNAWVDFNGDGDYLDPSEQVFVDQVVTDGENRLTIFTPSSLTLPGDLATRQARFRLTTEAGTTIDGFEIGGEVEDYEILIASTLIPEPTDDVLVLQEDPGTPFIGNVATNDTLVGSGLTYVIQSGVSNGTLGSFDESTGAFSYLPDEDFFGSDTFVYQIQGFQIVNGVTLPVRSSTLGTVTLNVTPVNDVPVAIDHEFTVLEPSDTNGAPVSVITSADLLTGALQQADVALRVSPFDELEQGLSVVQLAATGATGSLVDIVPLSNPSDPTSVINGTYTADSFVQDPNGSFVVAGTLEVQVLLGEIASVTYRPSEDYNQFNPALNAAGSLPSIDTLVYTVADDGRTTLPNGSLAVPQPAPEITTATVTVTVRAQNDAPIANNDFLDSATIGAPLQEEGVVVIDVNTLLLGNDTAGNTAGDDEDSNANGHDAGISIDVSSLPAVTNRGATITVNFAGNIVLDYSAVVDFFGLDSFTYSIQDAGIDVAIDGTSTPNPKSSVTPAVVTLVVDPVNDQPGANDFSFETLEDVPFVITANELLVGAVGHGNAVLGAPFNESFQDNPNLRVISLNVAGGVTVNAANAGSQTSFDTENGQVESLNFDANGFLVDFVYRPATDYNADNPLSGGARSVDAFDFTVSDNGVAILPQGGFQFTGPETVTAGITVLVRPQNDDPILSDDVIVTGDPIWTMFSSESPAEDQTLIIPAAFLFANDAVGPATAGDELNGLNDGELALAPIAFTTTLGGNVRLLNDGNLSYTPPENVFGLDSFEYSALDRGIDEDATGGRVISRLNNASRATVMILVEPVNDPPVTFDRSLQGIEDNVVTFTASDLLNSSPPALPTNLSPLPPAPFDENEQTLRVVAFADADETVDVDDLTGGTGAATITTSTGATVTLNFVSGAFTTGTYVPALDYNQRAPFIPGDEFSYVIADDGIVTIPGSGTLSGGADLVVDLGDQRSEPATITVSLTADNENDAPQFDFQDTVEVSERDDNGETLIAWAANILPGPATALDEQIRETVRFDYVEGASTVPADLFRQDPVVAADGTLSLFLSPDAFGDATIVIDVTDVDSITPGFVPETERVSFTLNVRPVNDRPRINAALAGTSDATSADRRYSIDNAGVITYGLKEDNTSVGGDTSQPFIIPLNANLGATGFVAPGILDLFVAGPGNELDSSLGGSQVLSLLNFPSQTTLGGTLVLNSSGASPVLEYTPPVDYNSAIGIDDSFTYSVIDSSTSGEETFSIAAGRLVDDELTATNQVSLSLRPVNDAPVFSIANDFIEILEADAGAGIETVNGFANGIAAGPIGTAEDENSRVSGQTIEFNVTPSNFPIADIGLYFLQSPTLNTGGVLEYQPAPDVYGEFVFDVFLQDDGADIVNRGDINRSATESFTIAIRPVNDSPVIRPSAIDSLSFTVDEDSALDIPADASATSGDLLGAFLVGPPNEAADITPGGNQTLSIASVPTTTAQGATLVPVTDGNGDITHYRYERNDHFVGTDQFVYQIVDNGQSVNLGTGGVGFDDPATTDVTVIVEVLPVNDAPVFSGGDDIVVQEDQGVLSIPAWVNGILAGPIGAQDELNSQSVSIDIAFDSGDPSILTGTPTVEISGSNATLNLETTGVQNGVATYVATFTDDGPNDPANGDLNSVTHTFTVTVNPDNDPPTFTAGSPVVVDEDSGAFSTVWATNISPGIGEETEQTITEFTLAVPPGGESLFSAGPAIAADGTLTFTAAPDASGSVSIVVTAIDSLGGQSAPATLDITINEISDVPVPADDFINTDEDTVLTIDAADLLSNDLDPDLASNPAEFLTISMPPQQISSLGATVTFDSTTNQITYDPSTAPTLQELSPGESVVDSFSYGVIDSSNSPNPPTANVILTIEGVNDAPLLTPDQLLVASDAVSTLDLFSNDVDVDGTIDPSSIIITLQPQNGALTLQQDGTLTYVPEAGFLGPDAFRYTVADELGQQSEEALVTLDVGEAPATAGDIAGTFVDNPVTIAVLANDTANADPTSVRIESGPSNGIAELQADGSILYTPNIGFIGSDSFDYSVADSQGRRGIDTAVDVTVVASNLQNPFDFDDVNANGEVTALDALLIINRLADGNGTVIDVQPGERGPNFYDVNGSLTITSLDVLLVINELLTQQLEQFAQGELIEREQIEVLETPQVSVLSEESKADQLFGSHDFVRGVNPVIVDSIVDDPEDDSLEEAVDQVLSDLV